jgi:chitin deacetylase
MVYSEKIKLAARYTSFLLVTTAIWWGYCAWRPPAPMLGLRHLEHLGHDSSQVSLTIDDAPHPFTTPLLLAALHRANVKATFFVVGDGMRLYPELARRIVRDGHTLANHSQYHHNLTRISPSEYEHEIETCFSAIRRAGQQTRLFRPPGGGLNRDVMQYLYDNDVTLAWWSNNVGDWSPQPAWEIVRRVEQPLRSGDILLLHDAVTSTPHAIPAIVKAVRRRDLDFIVMPEARQ